MWECALHVGGEVHFSLPFCSQLIGVLWCHACMCECMCAYMCACMCSTFYLLSPSPSFVSLSPSCLPFHGCFSHIHTVLFCFVAQRFLTRAIHVSQGLELSFGASWAHHVVYDGLQWPILNFKLSAPFVSMYRWSCASSSHKLLVFNLDINYT